KGSSALKMRVSRPSVSILMKSGAGKPVRSSAEYNETLSSVWAPPFCEIFAVPRSSSKLARSVYAPTPTNALTIAWRLYILLRVVVCVDRQLVRERHLQIERTQSDIDGRVDQPHQLIAQPGEDASAPTISDEDVSHQQGAEAGIFSHRTSIHRERYAVRVSDA